MKKMIVGLVATLLCLSAFAGFIDERSKVAPAEASAKAGADLAASTAAPAAVEVDLTLVLRTGDLISERLTEWAKRNGYALSWDAPEYRSGADLVLKDDFDKSLDMFLGSMRLNKVRLEAEIFANNSVRILEVK